MTTNQILIAIESLGFIGADAFGIAASALVARKLGAGEVEAAQRAGWLAAGLGGAALLLVSALFLLQAEPLLRMFSEDPRVLQIGLHCLMIATAAQPLMAIAQSLAGALRGAGDTTTPLLVALLAPLGLRLTLCWWLAFELELGLAGIWWATTSDWLLRCVLLAAGFWRGRWQQVQLS